MVESRRASISILSPLVADFDTILRSPAERSRIFDEDDRHRIMTVNGLVRGTVLVDAL